MYHSELNFEQELYKKVEAHVYMFSTFYTKSTEASETDMSVSAL
jgi:hypothetical protein